MIYKNKLKKGLKILIQNVSILSIVLLSVSTLKALEVSILETRGDKSILLKEQNKLTFNEDIISHAQTIVIDESKSYQAIDGLGYALTQASAMAISMLSAANQAEALNDLFNPVSGKGISILRITIGVSDLNDSLYSYNESNVSDDNFIPDTSKIYYIEQAENHFRIGASGENEAVFTGSNTATGDDFEWRFSHSDDGYWYIDRAAGGNLPRLRTDDTNLADMNEASSTGTWESFIFTEKGTVNSFSLAGPDQQYLLPI